MVKMMRMLCDFPDGYTKLCKHKNVSGDYLPVIKDERSAVLVALAVWYPIYGKAEIDGERPYKVAYNDDFWYVTGSLSAGKLGGTAEIIIRKSDGCIFYIAHSK